MMNLHYDHYKETVLDTVIKEEKDGYYSFEDTVFFGEKAVCQVTKELLMV